MRNSSDLPGGPTGPVFRLPNFGKPSRGRIAVSVVVGLVLLLLFSAKAMSSFYVNVLWFNSVGRSDVYWAVLLSKAQLVGVFTVGCFLFLWVNLLIADRLAPLTLPNTSRIFQIHQKTIWRGQTHLFDVAPTPPLPEKEHSREQDHNPILVGDNHFSIGNYRVD